MSPFVQQQQQQQILINTVNSDADDYFEHVEDNATESLNSILSNDPIEILIEMGFANRAMNQKLLAENNNDLNKVIELLTSNTNENADWFGH
jgi:hypothetical protein